MYPPDDIPDMRDDPFYFSEGPYHPLLQGVFQALSGPEVFVKITGKTGTGKTTLCEKLALFLQHKGMDAIFFDYPFETPEDMRAAVAKRLNLPESFNFARQMENRLQSEGATQKQLVLLFDECDRYSDATLQEIYRLTQIQQDQHRMLSIVLCGETSLDNRLLSDEKFKALLQHVTHGFILSSLDRDSLTQFVLQYFRHVNRPAVHLDNQAMTLFQKLSRGLPGPAAAMCQLVASARLNIVEQPPVTRDELLTLVGNSPLAADLLKDNRFYTVNRMVLIGPALAVVVIVSIGFLYQLTTTDTEQPAPLAAGSTTGVQQTPEPTPLVASPFVDQQSAAQVPAGADLPPVVFTVEDIEEPIIDAGLALVTALERGISAEQLATPQYEPLDAADELFPEVPVTEETVTAQTVSEETAPEDTVPEALQLAVTAPEQTAPEQTVLVETVLDETRPEDTVPEELLPGETLPSLAVAEASVSAWIDAWQSQELDAYFASYHAEFQPRYQDSVAEWRANRSRNVTSPTWIRLAMSELSLLDAQPDSMEVTLWLAYESPTYNDQTLKRLVLRPTDGRWLIVEEVNLEVRR